MSRGRLEKTVARLARSGTALGAGSGWSRQSCQLGSNRKNQYPLRRGRSAAGVLLRIMQSLRGHHPRVSGRRNTIPSESPRRPPPRDSRSGPLGRGPPLFFPPISSGAQRAWVSRAGHRSAADFSGVAGFGLGKAGAKAPQDMAAPTGRAVHDLGARHRARSGPYRLENGARLLLGRRSNASARAQSPEQKLHLVPDDCTYVLRFSD